MDILVMVGQMILALSILVGLHEWGHYITARMFGIRVEKFYIFFDAWGKKIWSKKIGGTEYGIGWLPLGGYVKIAGMIDESLDTDQMAQPAKDDEFRSKPAWQRLIVMLGGIIVNAILAIVIFMAILMIWGKSYLPISSLKNGIYATEMGQKAGLKTGDQLLKVNGESLTEFSSIISTELLLNADAKLEIIRNGEALTVNFPDSIRQYMMENKESLVEVPLPSIIHKIEKNMPAFASGMREGDEITGINGTAVSTYNEVFNIIPTVRGKIIPVSVLRNGQAMTFKVDLTSDPQFGIRSIAADSIYEVRSEKFGFFASIPEAFTFASETVSNQVKSFQKIFSGEVSARKSLGGPIAIAKDLYGGTWIWQKFWLTTALLSIVLAFMNLLPIPALDGGHALFTLIEMIIRRPLSTKFLTYAQYVGMIIIFGLMIFIIGNDLLKLFL